MRYALLFALCTLACAAEPVLLPDASTPDAGPCGGACGAGTVCVSGACVAVDAGSPVDAGALDAGTVDAGEDRPGVVDVGAEAGPIDAGSDVPLDAGPMDALPTGCTSITAGNCCGVACPTPAHGVAACLGGRCGVANCEANYGDCDGDPANGCETDTRATTAHCGACGAACSAGRDCVDGACVACPIGAGLCMIDPRCTALQPNWCRAGLSPTTGAAATNFCTNVANDNNNCGSCGGEQCRNGVYHCEAGRCVRN